MELEFHQLDLCYERLKVVRPEQERRLLASLAEVGQQFGKSPPAVAGLLHRGLKRLREMMSGDEPNSSFSN